MEARSSNSVLSGWATGGESPRDARIELSFAVKQRGLEELHDTLMRVSMPSSPDYGKHLSNEEVNAMTAPDPEHIRIVEDFLALHGAVPVAATPNSDFIHATVSVETAERMLSAKYVQLVHGESGVEVTRAPQGYRLPAAVAAVVDFVSPTVHVPGVRRPQEPQDGKGSPAAEFNTPDNLRQLYSIDVEGKADGNIQGVTAFLEQGFRDNSLKKFWSEYCADITCGKGEVGLVGDATSDDVRVGVESMLDIETITGIAGNVESEFWGFAGRSPDNVANEPFTKWMEQVSSTGDDVVPKVFSTSYGEDENSWSYDAEARLNVEFQKAGARGISLLFASGDSGANCESGSFKPQTPGSSPYITAVGGTQPTAEYPVPGSESAIGLSSGGFSDYWPMPEWQEEAVKAYLQEDGLPDQSTRGYNISGRAYPDISAQATNFIVIAGVTLPGVAGTSCASPAAAGIFGLLNDLRMQNGMSSLGFLNPFIYSHMSAFNDITTGRGEGCVLQQDGWPAKTGWDAVTGAGTPNYAKLAEAVLALPAGHARRSMVSV